MRVESHLVQAAERLGWSVDLRSRAWVKREFPMAAACAAEETRGDACTVTPIRFAAASGDVAWLNVVVTNQAAATVRTGYSAGEAVVSLAEHGAHRCHRRELVGGSETHRGEGDASGRSASIFRGAVRGHVLIHLGVSIACASRLADQAERRVHVLNPTLRRGCASRRRDGANAATPARRRRPIMWNRPPA